MPDRQTTFDNQAQSKRLHTTPVLPTTDTWQAADFTLQSVMSETESPGRVNLRQYAVRLLARYLYVSGE